MDEQNQRGDTDNKWTDMEDSNRNSDTVAEVGPDDPLRLQAQIRANPHERAHVNLQQEEYTPEEAARMLGTSVEVIMHAARSGELVAEKVGHKVVCIKHADLTNWLDRQGPGV